MINTKVPHPHFQNIKIADKMYLYAKDFHEQKYQLLINKHEKVHEECFKDPKAFTEFSNNLKGVQNIEDPNIKDYNSKKKRLALIVFDNVTRNLNQ